jgi:hypothetical protein
MFCTPPGGRKNTVMAEFIARLHTPQARLLFSSKSLTPGYLSCYQFVNLPSHLLQTAYDQAYPRSAPSKNPGATTFILPHSPTFRPTPQYDNISYDWKWRLESTVKRLEKVLHILPKGLNRVEIRRVRRPFDNDYLMTTIAN